MRQQNWADPVPYDFLSRILGGGAFTLKATIVNNGLSLTCKALIDTGADGYLFISLNFAKRVLKLLQPRQITGFQPYPVGGYDRKTSQTVDVALQTAFRIDGRTELNAPLMVLDMHHDMIVGLKWFTHHKVNIIPSERRLEFPEGWGRGPKPTDIPMDADGHQQRQVHWDEDAQRRDQAMDLEDKRRRDGRQPRQLEPAASKRLSSPPPSPTVEDESEPESDSDPEEETPTGPPRVENTERRWTRPCGDPDPMKNPEWVAWQAETRWVNEVVDYFKHEYTEEDSDLNHEPSPTLTQEYLSEADLLPKASKLSENPMYTPKASPSLPRPTVGTRRDQDTGLRQMEALLSGLQVKPSPFGTRDAEGCPEVKLVEKPTTYEQFGRTYVLRRGNVGFYKHFIDVAVIGAVAFSRLAHENPLGNPIDVTTLHEIDKLILDRKEERLTEQLPHDEDALREAAFKLVPPEYHDELRNFSKHDSDILAPHRYIDHKIKLQDGVNPESLGFSGLYKMSLEELEAARKYITENLKKGFIESSNAPWAAPVLMAKKADGGLRFCVDYRKLNALSKRDVYPLPLIDETLAQISKAKIFTKIDIRQAFHRIRLAEGDEDLTTFRLRYGSFKYKVLPFGLSNGPSTFQRFINDTLREHLDEFCHAYIDDILIFSNSLKEHKGHVKWVLQRLREAGLQADLKKCEFHVTQTKYLGFIIGVNGVSPDPDKIMAIREWEPPSSVKEVQAFLGFANFYRRFIQNYSRIAKPLTDLTRKQEPWQWGVAQQSAFDGLRLSLMSAPLLRYFDHSLETRVETDASGGVLAAVMSQRQEDDDDWHPVAFWSKTMNGPELNYAIHDKELMAIVKSLEAWRSELEGLQRATPFEVITDHRALEYFMTKRLLNSRQANWADLLSRYHFVITYRPGADNTIADSLTRKAQELRTLKSRKEDERTMAIFKELDKSAGTASLFVLDDQLTSSDPLSPQLNSLVSNLCLLDSDADPPPLSGVLLADALLQANQTDPALEVFRQRARDGSPHWSTVGGKYTLFKGRLVVSATDHLRTRVIEELHARITAAHPGKSKTRRSVASKYWWPALHGDVDIYVNNCLCRSAKHPRDKTPGFLHPIPVPLRPWHHVVIDFCEMPLTKSGKNNTFNIIDKFSKETWSTACDKAATSKDVAWMYYMGPLRAHGLPLSVGSDRGPQFVSDFTDELSKILGMKWKPSSSGHSQSAGQIENYHEWMQQRLRLYTSHYQNNWDLALPAMDVAQASTPHDALGGMSPFEVTHGFSMPLGFDWEHCTNLTKLPAKERLNRKEAQEMAATFKQYVEVARKCLLQSQDRMVKQANKHRREPDFGVGDKVFIIKKIWSTDRPSEKLNYPLTQQSFRILAMKGFSYELEVPPSWRATTVFHADRLRLDPDNPLPGQEYARPDAELIDEEEEWEVDQILSSRLHYGRLQYQVQWRGWDPDPEYYDAREFKNAPDAIAAFHEKNPDCEGPPLRLAVWAAAWVADKSDPDHEDDNKVADRKGIVKLRRSARLRTK